MKKAAHRQGSSASRPVRCAVSCLPLSHLRHEVAHGLGCFILLLAGGVGVGPEGKPGVVVSQHGGDCLNVHTVLKGPGGFGVATGPRGGGRVRPGLSGQARNGPGCGHHRLQRRIASVAVTDGRGSPDPWSLVPHGGADAYGPVVPGCAGGAGGPGWGFRDSDWPERRPGDYSPGRI